MYILQHYAGELFCLVHWERVVWHWIMWHEKGELSNMMHKLSDTWQESYPTWCKSVIWHTTGELPGLMEESYLTQDRRVTRLDIRALFDAWQENYLTMQKLSDARQERVTWLAAWELCDARQERVVLDLWRPFFWCEQKLDLTQHKLVHDGPLVWRLRSHRLIELQVLLLEDILVLLQRADERLVLKCQSTNQLSIGNDYKYTHSPVLKLQNLLARNVATGLWGMSVCGSVCGSICVCICPQEGMSVCVLL